MEEQRYPFEEKPTFAITHLHIRGLRGLKSIDLPENGLGWRDAFPQLAVIGGANGSGKTTLLRCITQAARLLVSPTAAIPSEVGAEECRIDFTFADGFSPVRTLRFLVGNKKFVEANESADCYGYIRTGARPRSIQRGTVVDVRKEIRPSDFNTGGYLPRLVFLPSEDRELVVPNVKYKQPGNLVDDLGFVSAWERVAPNQWRGSLVELLFSARWADLNAKEEGVPEAATNFDSYTRAFADLSAKSKKLGWTSKGELVVQLKGGKEHPVADLSSGERQALLLTAELRRRWTPGSLVLIDELELHLHDAWQARMLDVLQSMQKELGGQVIVTTQSHSLFEMAPLGTRALLGREAMR
ncbi:MAG: AAA family ATPase [Myxococcota bacterium]